MFWRPIDTHLALKLFNLYDAEEAYAVIDRNRDHLRQFLPWADSVNSVENERIALKQLAVFDPDTQINCFLTLDQCIIGSVSLPIINRRLKYAEIGYWIDSGYEGRGYVTAGVREMERLCFIDLGLERVQITNEVANTRSRAIPERLGYTFEGILRHHVISGDGKIKDRCMYSILKPEWVQREES